MHQPSVAIVILNYNGYADTADCLRSLAALRYANVRVIVVDNGSDDGSAGWLRAEFPGLELIETGANLGFAAGNNLGMRVALDGGAEFVLLLNNDTIVAPTLLDALLDVCRADPMIGVAGPKISYHAQPDVIWSAGGAIDWRRGRSSMRGLDETDRGQWDAVAPVDFVTGCALLVRRSALEQAGLLDERFGMYYEETEWCARIGRAGWRIVYVPDGRVWHKIRPAQQDQSPRITYYMTRNRLLFLRLTAAPISAWIHALLLQDLRTWCAWRVLPRWRGRSAQRVALRSAWRDFVFNRFGMA